MNPPDAATCIVALVTVAAGAAACVIWVNSELRTVRGEFASEDAAQEKRALDDSKSLWEAIRRCEDKSEERIERAITAMNNAISRLESSVTEMRRDLHQMIGGHRSPAE
jgi:hypothetical protein